MNFEFAKYTEVTDFAHEVNPEYKTGNYSRIFICPDVLDYWLVRVLEGYNEEYEKEEGCFVLEREKIGKSSRSENLTIRKLREILENDTFESWDIQEYHNIDELIEDIDGGFGILNLKEI